MTKSDGISAAIIDALREQNCRLHAELERVEAELALAREECEKNAKYHLAFMDVVKILEEHARLDDKMDRILQIGRGEP